MLKSRRNSTDKSNDKQYKRRYKFGLCLSLWLGYIVFAGDLNLLYKDDAFHSCVVWCQVLSFWLVIFVCCCISDLGLFLRLFWVAIGVGEKSATGEFFCCWHITISPTLELIGSRKCYKLPWIISCIWFSETFSDYTQASFSFLQEC